MSVTTALLLAALAAASAPGTARGAEAGAPVPRTVLALFDGAREGAARDGRIQRFAALPLQHLGYRLRFHDVAAGPPPERLPADVAAALTWWDGPPAGAARLSRWAARAERAGGGLRLIAFGHPGASGPEAAAHLARLGLSGGTGTARLGLFSRETRRDPAFLGFETDPLAPDGRLPDLRAAPEARTLYSVSDGAAAVDLAVLGPRGGYAHGALLPDPAEGAFAAWALDPFAFFAAALGGGPRPAPDPTTLNGLRAAFVTVGGEGLTARAAPARYGAPGPLAAEALSGLLAAAPDIPVTVAAIAGDLEPELAGPEAGPAAEALAAILALPQTRPAAETRTAPRDWDAVAARGPEAGAAPAFAGLRRAVAAAFPGALGGGAPARRHEAAPFRLDAEIGGALAAVGARAPGGAPARLLRWSGDARPFEAALAAAREAGVAAMGGGGGVLHALSPSIAGLSAFSAPVGAERQVLDALSGAPALRAGAAPSWAFRRLAESWARTEAPRRLKPMQLHLDFATLARPAERAAFAGHLAALAAAPAAPVTAAAYARAVEGFERARLRRLGPMRWRVEARGALQTVRFDAAAGLALDPGRSRGVLGARRANGALYAALDPTAPAPIVALGAGPASGPGPFLLLWSRWRVAALERRRCAARFAAWGWGPGEMVWRVPAPGSYAVEARDRAGALVWSGAVEAAADGRLALTLPRRAAARGALAVAIDGCGRAAR